MGKLSFERVLFLVNCAIPAIHHYHFSWPPNKSKIAETNSISPEFAQNVGTKLVLNFETDINHARFLYWYSVCYISLNGSGVEPIWRHVRLSSPPRVANHSRDESNKDFSWEVILCYSVCCLTELSDIIVNLYSSVYLHKTSNKYKFITLLRMLVNKVFTMMQAFQKKLSDFSESRLP